MDTRLLIVLALVALSCREAPTSVSTTPTATYRIEGQVTDRFLNPVKNADVYLYYNYNFMDMEPVPVFNWYVPDASRLIVTAVYDFEGTLRRVLSVGTRPVGGIYADWDGLDSAGVQRNGVFQVRYIMDDTVRHYYIKVIDGVRAARTDSNGRYVISSQQLPIGFYPAPLYSADGSRFSGNYDIDPRVDLVFSTPISHRQESVFLLEGVVRRLDVIIQ